jgi:hypothetical protein
VDGLKEGELVFIGHVILSLNGGFAVVDVEGEVDFEVIDVVHCENSIDWFYRKSSPTHCFSLFRFTINPARRTIPTEQSDVLTSDGASLTIPNMIMDAVKTLTTMPNTMKSNVERSGLFSMLLIIEISVNFIQIRIWTI